MTTLISSTLLYLELSLLIAVALLLFRAVRLLAARLGLRLGATSMTRLARAVLLATLLSPVAAHLLLPGALRLPWLRNERPTATVGLAAAELRGLPLTAEPLPPEGASVRWRRWLGYVPGWQIELALSLVAAFLIGGVAISGGRTMRRLGELRALVRDSVPLRRFGRLRIVVCDRTSVPFSTAVHGLTVVVPVELLEDIGDLRVVLRHELQHYRRRDPQWAIALELLRVLFFWHPAARGWVDQLMELQELACDEALVRGGVPAGRYGACLLRVAEMAVHRRLVASTAMATAADCGANLRRRIDMLLDYNGRNDSRPLSATLRIGGVMVILCTALVSAASWPTAADLRADTGAEGALATTIETLARANEVRVDSVITNDETLMTIALLGAPVERMEAMLDSLIMEPSVELEQLKLDKSGNEVRATLALREGPSAPGAERIERVRSLIDHMTTLLQETALSSAKLVFEGRDVTVYTRDGDCMTGENDVVLVPAPVGSAEWREAPDLEFVYPDGSQVSLSELRGKVVLVDFWAGWCGPCAAELPHLEALNRALGGADFEIVGVSLNRNREEFESFITEHEVPWAQLHQDGGMHGAAAEAFGVRALPSHYLIDRDGRYVQVPLGDPEVLNNAVVSLISGRKVADNRLP